MSVETPQEREARIARMEQARAKRKADQGSVWPTPDDAGTGVVPLEVGPGRGDLYRSSGFIPTFPTALSLVGNRAVSFARLFMSQPWVAAAVMRMLTWSVRVPMRCYRRTGADNDRKVLGPDDHPVAGWIHKPWTGGSQAQLVMSILGPLLVHGNGLNELDDSGRSLSSEGKDWRFVMPLMPWRGSLVGWKVDVDTPEFSHEVSSDKTLHVAWWSPTGPIGVSPLQQLGVTLQIEDALQRYQRASMANGARPSAAVVASEAFLGIDPVERRTIMRQLRADINELYSGPDNSGRPALLPPGLNWNPVGQTTVEAALIEQRKITREEIAAVYLLAPPILGIMDKANYCLPGDSLVQTDRGPVPIMDVQAGDRVWSVKDGDVRLSTVSHSRCTGVRPLLTVKTTNRTLRCTDNHPILVARVRGTRWVYEWRPAGEIARGDLIVTAGKIDGGKRCCPTREHVSVGFMEFCGLLLGDGSVCKDATGAPAVVTIGRAKDARYMEPYREAMRAEFSRMATGGKGVLTENRKRLPITLQESDTMTRFSSRLAATELIELGLSGIAATKEIPAWVFELAPDLRAAFARGFCDADGSVDKRGHLSVHSSNEYLLRQMRELFIGLGVPVCNVRAQRSWVKLPDGRKVFSVMWTFKAADPEANALIIGSHNPQDRARMAAGKSWGRKGRTYRDARAGIAPRIGECGLAKVVSVQEGEVSVPVYDLTVPGAHSFIADGVVVHNSNMQSVKEMTYTDSLGPPLVLLEQCINAQVCRDLYQDPDVFVEFDFSVVLRGDPLAQIAAVRDAIGSALMTPNEGRDVLHRPAADQDGMDEFYLPTNNLSPVGTKPQPVPPQFGGDGEGGDNAPGGGDGSGGEGGDSPGPTDTPNEPGANPGRPVVPPQRPKVPARTLHVVSGGREYELVPG